MSKSNAARPQRQAITMHNGAPLNADPNGNRAQRRAAAKRGIKVPADRPVAPKPEADE